MTRTVLTLGGIAATLLLTACQSDSGDTAPPTGATPTPGSVLTGAEGSWAGTIDTPTAGSRQLQAAVLDDGRFWMVYSGAGDGRIGGILQGTGTTASGVFTVDDATLLSLEDDTSSSADIKATFTTGSRFEGSITPAAGTAPVSLPSPALFSSLYQLTYNTALSLGDLAGQYTGNITTRAGTETATVTIDADGDIAGASSSGCLLTGKAAAEPQGNLFELDATFGNEPACGGNATTQVFGIITLEADKATALAMDSLRSNSFIFTGTR